MLCVGRRGASLPPRWDRARRPPSGPPVDAGRRARDVRLSTVLFEGRVLANLLAAGPAGARAAPAPPAPNSTTVPCVTTRHRFFSGVIEGQTAAPQIQKWSLLLSFLALLPHEASSFSFASFSAAPPPPSSRLPQPRALPPSPVAFVRASPSALPSTPLLLAVSALALTAPSESSAFCFSRLARILPWASSRAPCYHRAYPRCGACQLGDFVAASKNTSVSFDAKPWKVDEVGEPKREREGGKGKGGVKRGGEGGWARLSEFGAAVGWMPPRHKLRDVSVLLAPSMRTIALIPELSLPSLVSGFDL